MKNKATISVATLTVLAGSLISGANASETVSAQDKSPVPPFTQSFKGTLQEVNGKDATGGTVQVLAYQDLSLSTASQSQKLVNVGDGKINSDGSFSVTINPALVKQNNVTVQPGGNLAVTVVAKSNSGDASIVPGGAHTDDGGKTFQFNTGDTSNTNSATAPDLTAAGAQSTNSPQSVIATSIDGQQNTLRAHHFVKKNNIQTASFFRPSSSAIVAQDTNNTSSTPVGPRRQAAGILGTMSTTDGDGKFFFTFSYANGRTAESELGVGLSYGSGYSNSKTMSVSSNVSTTFPRSSKVGRTYYRGTFLYQEYSVSNDFGGWNELRPVGYSGGGSSSLSSATPFNYCSGAMDPGVVTSITQGRATNWTNALKVGGENGSATLSARSGYSSAVNIYIQNGSVSHHVCGDNGYPNEAGSLEVRG